MLQLNALRVLREDRSEAHTGLPLTTDHFGRKSPLKIAQDRQMALGGTETNEVNRGGRAESPTCVGQAPGHVMTRQRRWASGCLCCRRATKPFQSLALCGLPSSVVACLQVGGGALL